MSVRDVAAAAKVSPNTVTRAEAGWPADASVIAAIRSAFEAAGAEFTNGGEPRVKMRKAR
jgi:DNA-binding LacI/PurR family transcriptional regulator